MKFCFFFLKWGQEALSLSDHRNWAILDSLSNVACYHNLMHSRAHKHVDQTRLINPDYSSTQLLNIHTVFHLFLLPNHLPHQANMVLIKLTLLSAPHCQSHASLFLSKCSVIGFPFVVNKNAKYRLKT